MDQEAEWSWGECKFDDILNVFTVAVYGRWEDPPPEEDDSSSEGEEPPFVT
jgi:hypothetical protein